MSIGTKIRKLRESKKMSQRELALKVGIEQTTLGSIENGNTKKVDFLLMDKICIEFEVGFEYFLEEKGDKYSFKKNENNNIVVGKIEVLNNTMPEGILESIIKRLDHIEKSLNK
ncbi:helix-turn-helix domain-containing protein [Flavobacterium sp.]|jgi:transcriptional regulator with XRE-family HTH domain|uniref:helix-turn-helix domain-containing protein n=1 Tax=Flavobacterium sp. TaxID=239 RepID=UPI0037BF8822